MISTDEKLNIFYQISKAVTFISDAKGLERHIAELLKKLVTCNSILIFHNNHQQQKFIAQNPYNLFQLDSQSVSFSHDDSISTDILVNRKSVTRLLSQKSVLPLMNAELFIPLISPDDIMGCLYVSRLHANDFDADDIRLLEHAATHLSFALERQSWYARLEKLGKSNFTWQDKYIAFLEVIPFPAAIVDVTKDSIDEANKHLLTLLGFDAHDYINVPFSNVCMVGALGSLADQTTVSLKTRVGDIKPRQAVYRLFYDHDQEKHLFVFLPNGKDANVNGEKWRSFFELSQSLHGAFYHSQNVDDLIFNVAREIHKVIPFNFLSLTLLDELGQGRPFRLCTREMESRLEGCLWDEIENERLGWVHSKEGETQQIAPKEKSLPFTMPWHCSLLLVHKENYVGNLALGRLYRSFTDDERIVLKSLAESIAQSITRELE